MNLPTMPISAAMSPYPKNRKSRGPCSPEMKAKISESKKRYNAAHPEEIAANAKKAGATLKAKYASGELKPNKWVKQKGRKGSEKQKAAARAICGDKHPNWKGGAAPVTCQACDKVFEARPSVNRKYCTHACYAESLKLNKERHICPDCGGKKAATAKRCGACTQKHRLSDPSRWLAIEDIAASTAAIFPGRRWMVHPEYSHIAVSDHGELRWLRSNGKARKGGVPSSKINKKGYVVLSLNRKMLSVHRMVAQCFVPNPGNLRTVNHIDGDKTNNHFSNLEWATALENIQHAWKTGLMRDNRGENNVKAKLTEDRVRLIRILSRFGEVPYAQIARACGVSEYAISAACRRKTWRHVS